MKKLFAGLRALVAAGRGRALALVMLAVFAGMVLVPRYSMFKTPQTELFDRYQRVFPRERASAPVTLVEVDEKSLKALGQWPWPRDRLAHLIERIAGNGALAIGLDMYFPEADGASPEALAARMPALPAATREALTALPTHDAQFRDAIGRAPVVLGVAGMNAPAPGVSSAVRHRPMAIEGGDAAAAVRRFPYGLSSLPALQAAASGQAVLSVDLDGGVVRRIPLAAAIGADVMPGLALEMLRVATGSQAVWMKLDRHGVASAGVADLAVPTLPSGEAWLYAGHADGARYVSAVDAIEGRAPREMFEGKLVIVGLSGMGLNDMRLSALGELVPGMELQAQLIENLIDGTLLHRPQWLIWLECGLLLVLGLALVWAVPNVRPRVATLLTVALQVGLFGAGFAVFKFTGHLFDAATLFAALSMVFANLLGSVFIEADRARRAAQEGLQQARVEAARVSGELDAARRIQLGSLPQPQAVFPGETRFEIAASLEPAREVGGDLYDFYRIDERHVFFVVGDVSGKGLPASLFMAVTKALAKSVALRGVAVSVGEIVSLANHELVRENPEALFVTLVAGVIDVDSGRVEICNAGHDAPWVLSAQTLRRIEGEGGPPLCMIEDFIYPSISLQLQPGETLCVVTDGITEALDVAGARYGVARVEALLERIKGASADALVAALREDVRGFVGAAEPADDLTLLALRWAGPEGSSAR